MIIFIHGINQQKFIGREKAIEALWNSLLDIAFSANSFPKPESAKHTKMFFYADLTVFSDERKQSAPALKLEEEMLHEVSSDNRDQGLQNHPLALEAARSIDQWPLLERILGRAILKVFAEESIQYLENEDTQNGVHKRFLSVAHEKVDAIIGHSLGSVIAYQLVCRYPSLSQNLITLGSPLGSESFLRRLHANGRPKHPTELKAWTDIYDKSDVVSCRPIQLTRLFDDDPSRTVFKQIPVRNDTDNRHGIEGYLAQSVLAEALSRKSQP